VLNRNETKSRIPPGRILNCVEGFAPLPAVAMRVIDMASDPEASASDLESVLQGDVSLVAAVLKLANSAFYGLRRQVSSLRHALLLLGKSEVQGLVLSRVMLQAFKVPGDNQKALMVGVWRHSLECALASECVAEQCGEEGAVYFLGGMLHDIGKLVIVQKFLNSISDLDRYDQLTGVDSLQAEQECLGWGHEDLGAQLLHRWMFPVQLVEMVRGHHDFRTIGKCGRPIQILTIANLLSRWVALKELETADPENENRALELLLRCGVASGIISDEDALRRIEATFRKRLEERADLLEMLQI